MALALEGYYGQFDGDVYIAGNRLGVDVRVTDLTGVVLNLLSHNINVRLSYHSGYNDTDLPDFDLIRVPLEQAGFGRSADSLDSHGRIHIVQGALSYDSLHSFWQAEWVRTTTEFDFTPELVGYYLTAGAYVGDVSLHATYAASSYGSVSGETELQPFLENPADPRFALARTYYGILDFIPDGSMDSYSVGARWNVRLDMALKAEISWLQETAPQSGFFANSASPQSKQSAWLYQLGWEWVF
ncbi:hypothetical protein CHH28_01780 [Bacterioplanes sanyensis]|uniref:Porin n=1 Tax=Bacterioplanes sanyensis TaxID=1249553 RepID=A0A222FGE3_9GAMM|nr:hypothetical protein [Bacterioplanes sanyensis]ASP37481.1 hypothetical protein CHH28_01780 [Bacterioplanes sanyensis]